LSEIETTEDYYDHHWSFAGNPSPREEERIRQTISLIPEDVSSILDVGCGDGRITNHLIPQYSRVVGLESSKEALQYVKTEKMLGSIDCLPFPDRNFDLVLCCEVLEHLPFRVYPKAIEELERVASKYILVTVPNSEDLKQNFVTCPHCGCIFHVWRHLRSFKQESAANLLNEFKVEIMKTYRPLAKVYPILTVMGKVARYLKLAVALDFPTDALCPQCGYSSAHKASSVNSDKERSHFSFLIPPAKVLGINKKAKGWLMVLYQRTQE